jgi:hypothetical protein
MPIPVLLAAADAAAAAVTATLKQKSNREKTPRRKLRKSLQKYPSLTGTLTVLQNQLWDQVLSQILLRCHSILFLEWVKFAWKL